jgi:hypothetical protein
MMRAARVAACAVALGVVIPARAEPPSGVTAAYTSFDADRNCRHRPGRDVEDYGTWTCRGFAGTAVLLSAGDQRMTVSFGPRAGDEVAAGQTLPGFNDVYKGTIEWRVTNDERGKARPLATILRWNYMTSPDDRRASGRMLVVTRLNPGGVCHVGYIDGRAPDANARARKIADEKARAFRCGTDKAENY